MKFSRYVFREVAISTKFLYLSKDLLTKSCSFSNNNEHVTHPFWWCLKSSLHYQVLVVLIVTKINFLDKCPIEAPSKQSKVEFYSPNNCNLGTALRCWYAATNVKTIAILSNNLFQPLNAEDQWMLIFHVHKVRRVHKSWSLRQGQNSK